MAKDIFDILQPRTPKEVILGSLPGGKTKSEQPFTLETLKDIEQIKSHGEWLDMMEKIQEFKAPEDYLTLTNRLEARKVREKLGEAINKKGEELGFTGKSDEDYGRFDRGPLLRGGELGGTTGEFSYSEEAKKSGMKKDQDIARAKAIASGASEKKKEKPYEGPFGKLGEYFSKNADAREKLFTYIGEMGKELVKPIEPGQAAAGALVPTLSRGLGRGQKKYQEAQVEEAKMLKDLAAAQRDANPLQFYTNKMKEARFIARRKGVDPDTAEGTAWIGNWLQTQGIASGAAELSAAIKSMSDAMMQETDPNKKKDYQKQIDMMNEQLTAIIVGSGGGGYEEEVIDYSTTIGKE